MERSRLKTIMILILAMVNLFFVCDLGWQYLEDWSIQRQMEARLETLFAADGVTLNPDVISREKPPESALLTRDEELEAEVASFFLEGRMMLSAQGGIRQYSAGDVTVRFYSDGDFTVSGLSVHQNAEAYCRNFCLQYGYQLPEVWEAESGVLSATARYRGEPVVNCKVSFSFEEGVLRGISGALLPRKSAAVLSGPVLSAVEALAVFQAREQATGEVVSAISGVSLCYELRKDAPSGLALDPAWRVSTDTVTYYVNGVNGEVTSA